MECICTLLCEIPKHVTCTVNFSIINFCFWHLLQDTICKCLSRDSIRWLCRLWSYSFIFCGGYFRSLFCVFTFLSSCSIDPWVCILTLDGLFVTDRLLWPSSFVIFAIATQDRLTATINNSQISNFNKG